jgi:hypothetical protein
MVWEMVCPLGSYFSMAACQEVGMVSGIEG